jgi:hypothetical protein
MRATPTLRFRVRDLFKLMLWVAVALTVARLLYLPESRQWIHHGVLIGLAASFIVAPAAAIGAMLDRFWWGLLLGIGVVLLWTFTMLVSNS